MNKRRVRLLVSTVVFVLSSLFWTDNINAQNEFWSTPQKINTNTPANTHAISPATVTDSKGYFHSVWMEIDDNYGWGGSDNNPGIKYSFWNGDVWSTPEVVSLSNYATETPSITVDSSDNLYVVWQDSGKWSDGALPPNPQEALWRVILRKKTDAGWQTPVSVSQGLDAFNSAAIWPRVAVDSTGKIHVVFAFKSDLTNSNLLFKVYYTNSTDGISWTAPVLVSDGIEDNTPSLVVDSGNNLHLTYWTVQGVTTGVKYRRLPAGSSTWDAPISLSSNNAETPKVTVDGSNNVYVVWNEFVNGSTTKVFESRRPNGGSFSSPFQVTADAAYSFWGYPITGVTTDTAGNAYVGWGQLEANGTVTARYRKWTASNNTWSTNSTIRTTQDMDAPFIFKDKWDNQHFVWTEQNASSVWETWYSVVPANIEVYNPASQLTMTHPVTGDKIVIPSNALASSATVSAQIGPLPASANPSFTTLPRSYTYRPHGLTFINSKTATVTVVYGDSEIVGTDERNMKVYFWDGATSSWSTPAGSVNAGANKVTVTLNHFSLYGILTPKVSLAFAAPGGTFEGTNLPVSFDLTYISDGSAVPAIVEGLEEPVPGSNVALVLKDSLGNVVRTIYSDTAGGNQFVVNEANYQANVDVNGLSEGDYTLEVLIGGTFIGSSQVHLVPVPPVTVNFLAPLVSGELYTMEDGSTLPVKFSLYQNGTMLTTQQNVTIEVSGFASAFVMGVGSDNIRFDPTTGQYILNLHTRELGLSLGTHNITVKVDASLIGNVDFELLDGGKAKGQSR